MGVGANLYASEGIVVIKNQAKVARPRLYNLGETAGWKDGPVGKGPIPLTS